VQNFTPKKYLQNLESNHLSNGFLTLLTPFIVGSFFFFTTNKLARVRLGKQLTLYVGCGHVLGFGTGFII
jgi:hypothetical protein